MSSFLDFVLGFILLFFWVMAIWIFIQVFADIFRRRDLSGAWKVIWIVILFAVPFLGALIYIIARPVTQQDKEDMARISEAQRRIEGYSAADEIAKLVALRDAGSITAQEFETLKQRALTTV